MMETFLHLATQIKEKLPMFIGGLGILLIIVSIGIEYIKNNHNISNGVSMEIPQTFTATESNAFSRKFLKIDIEGAVQQPGIYELPDDSRIQDVLISAGGMTAKANRTIVSKDLNLAQRVFDGQKIYIPEVGEDAINNVSILSSQENQTNTNINTATESQLDLLPGIGPVTANKIIASRPYQSISELLTKHLVSASIYDKIKNSITVY